MLAALMETVHQKTLQLIKNDEWDAAHRLIQDYSDPLACRIHGYLHRIEGDLINARFWYDRVGLVMPSHSLQQELHDLQALSQGDPG